MDKKIEEKNEKQAAPKDEKQGRIRIRQLPDRPLGLIQGT